MAIAEGQHLFPSRTQKLSPPAPMVLVRSRTGRVGRRRFNFFMRTLLLLCIVHFFISADLLYSGHIADSGMYPAEKGLIMGVSYFYEERDTPFSYGYSLDVSKSGFSLNFLITNPLRIDYSFSLDIFAAEAKDYSASSPSFGTSLYLSRYLAGD